MCIYSLHRNKLFPKTPGELDRYVYELSHHLVADQDCVELCGMLSTDVWRAIASREPLQASLQQQATVLGLKKHVRFLGFLADDQKSD